VTDETRFSLLLPVYAGDVAEYFRRAFTSAVDDQTLRPTEAVIVQDGPIGDELEGVVASIVEKSTVDTRVVRIEKNAGLAHALTVGLQECRFDIVARMDADDVALPERFARQVPLVAGGLDMVGSGMLEFDANGSILGRRVPPVGDEQIHRVAKLRDPFNHPTVVYRRSAVLAAGGYRELPLMEDYWLFARMLNAGAKTDNIADPLVMYRVDAGAYSRRGGFRLFTSELTLQWHFREEGFLSTRQFLRNVAVRGAYRFVPTGLRRAMYGRVLVRDRSRGNR
jgi:glycosyltransferase involved in cell wall biosynthesis